MIFPQQSHGESTPGQAISVEESIPEISSVNTEEAASTNEALEYMKLSPGSLLRELL